MPYVNLQSFSEAFSELLNALPPNLSSISNWLQEQFATDAPSGPARFANPRFAVAGSKISFDVVVVPDDAIVLEIPFFPISLALFAYEPPTGEEGSEIEERASSV